MELFYIMMIAQGMYPQHYRKVASTNTFPLEARFKFWVFFMMWKFDNYLL